MYQQLSAQYAIEAIDEFLEELEAIVTKVEQDRDHQTADDRLQRWKFRTVKGIKAKFGAEEAAKFESDNITSVTHFNDRVGDRVREAERYKSCRTALKEEVVAHPEFALSQPGYSPQAVSQELVSPINPSCVFIIHGHDQANALKLRDLLVERWRLDPKILSAKPWEGRTLIEKFEEEAQEAAFAVALITPDDAVLTAEGESFQGRPNVIFELGWFCGKISRKKVTILLKHGTALHSDLDGNGLIRFHESVEEAYLDLERELKAAGVI